MADDLLESNIVIKTKVVPPNRRGFEVLLKDVDTLSKKLSDLTSKAWIVKLQIDDSELKKYGLARKSNGGLSSGNTGSSGVGSPVIPVASAGGQFFHSRRTVIAGEDITVTNRNRRNLPGGGSFSEAYTTKNDELVKYTRDEVDGFEKAIQSRLKANADALRQERRQQASIVSTDARRTRTAAREYTREVFSGQSSAALGGRVNDALTNGFRESAPTQQFNARTGEATNIRNLVRTSGNAFTGYTVEILKANEATKKLTIETLTGSRAMRFLGDNIQNAVSKVLLWSAATTAVFAGAAAIKQAAVETAKLEENTILLARVGQKFAGGASDFESRYKAAKQLTDQIITLTTIYGGNAAEAQQAAAIFARAGRDEKETLEATRVALIASKIAELELVEAAKFLSSAMLQFNLKAAQLLPTLDALNTLSNQYRVTTNDLLQSISRTGGVFAEHNGRLTELAAITAVVSQVTSRSGSEIGNALKTISSNLDRVDTASSLFQKMGLATADFSGESKSLGRTIFELKTKFDDLDNTEEKHLTLQIAGVRQRNILIAAIKNADEALIAENKTLLETGSATKEFYEYSQSTISALQRLAATLIKVSQESSKAFLPLIRSLINTVDLLLRTLNLFNGLPVKIITVAGGFFILTKAIAIASISLQNFYGAVVRSTVAVRTQAAGLIQQTAAMNLYQRATTIASAATTGFVASGGALTLGLVALTYAIGSAAQHNNTYADSLTDANTALQQSVDGEENRRRALHNTASAIASLIQRYDELKKLGKDDQAQKLAERGVAIGRSVGFGISSGNFSLEELSKNYVEQQRLSNAREQVLLVKQREEAIKKLSEAQVKQEAAHTKLYRLIDPSRHHSAIDESYIPKRRAEFQGAAKETEQALSAVQALSTKINGLKERSLAYDTDAARLAKASVDYQRSQVRFQEVEFNEKLRKSQDELDPVGSFQRLVEAHRQVAEETARSVTETRELLDLYDKGIDIFDDVTKKVEQTTKLLERQRDLEQELNKIRQSSSQKAAEGSLGLRARLLERGGLFAVEQGRRLANLSTYGDDVAGLDFRAQQQRVRFALARRAAGLAANESGPEAAGIVRAAQTEQQTAIVNLKSIEEERTLAILNAEKQIAIERKKSADEAARAVGSLSAEDKIRVRALAGYFTRNPDRKLSIDEQFLISGSSGRLIQQFFPGRLENLTDARGPFAAALRNSGIGITEDLQKGEKEIDSIRRGRSDADLLNQTLARNEELERKLFASQGIPLVGSQSFQGALGVGPGSGVNARGGIDTRIPINLNGELIDIKPLLGAFQEAVDKIGNEKVQEMVSEVKRIIKEEQALNKRVIPRTAARGD
jgi:TP901 family phage tail tape measure protein